MEKQHKTVTIYNLLATTTVISLAIASFALCVICELKKSKKKELGVDSELCYLPQSQAFAYGIAALMCSSIAQIIGTALFISCRRSSDFKSSNTFFANILLLLSWTSFFIMMILTVTATSMNRSQAYGRGWVNGTCYLVKNGVYLGSGTLVLIATSSTLVSSYLMVNNNCVVHAQLK